MAKENVNDTSLNYIKLDYTLNTVEERLNLVNKIIEETPSEKLTKQYLERLADYLLLKYKKEKDLTQQQKGKDNILTENRKKHIYTREISLEGLAYSFNNNNENSNSIGEDGIYNVINDNKNILLTPKNPITDKDLAEVPGLAELTDTIHELEARFDNTKDPKQRKSLKDNIISLYKDRYILRTSHKGHINCINPTKVIYKM